MNVHRLVEGLHVLMKYDPMAESECSTTRGELFMGGPPPDSMDPADASHLARLNFRWDAHADSWVVFT